MGLRFLGLFELSVTVLLTSFFVGLLLDILLAFDPNHTNIQAIVHDFNAIHPKLQFTAETERDNTLNYLDISIHRTPTGMKTSIYRIYRIYLYIPYTYTNTIIPYTSNHPTQHRYATVKFLYNRLNTYDLEKEEHEHELNIIHNILHYNSFPIKHQKPHIHTLAQK